MFAVANVNGVPKVAIRGDLYADGTIAGSRIIAGDITATQIQANSITADRLVTGTITSASGKIGDLSVNSLSIADAAVTVPQAQTLTSSIFPGTTNGVNSFTVSVDTTGLAGKTLALFASWTGTLTYTSTVALNATSDLFINGTSVAQSLSIDRVGFASLSGSLIFSAKGGVMSFPVSVNITLATNVVLTFRTLFAVITKR